MTTTNDVTRREAVLRAAAGVGLGVIALKAVTAQAATDDIALLKALLTAERNAIKTYEAGAGVIDAATATDPLFAYAGVVKAIALHFRSQHVDHAAQLAVYLNDQGGTDDVGAGAAGIPSDFVANIKNVVDLASNAEKAAAVAYTNIQKSLSKSENAELAAAIGADETQHYVLLQLVARGFVVPPDSTKNQTADALATAVSMLAPRSFAVGVGSFAGLDDTALPFYDVTH
jgi:ferritin-like protein